MYSSKQVDYKEIDYKTLNKFGLSIKNFYITFKPNFEPIQLMV